MKDPLKSRSLHLKIRRLFIAGIVFGILALTAGSVFAVLTINGTTISGDSGVLIDTSSTISIGTSSSTGITIGRSGITATFPGTVTITGTTTTLQNLTVLGSLLDADGHSYSTSTSGTLPPTLCIPTTYTISYTASMFMVDSTVATTTLLTLSSPQERLCSITIDPQIAFTGSGITAVSATVGTPTPGNGSIFLPSADLTQITKSTTAGGSINARDYGDSSLAVQLTATANTNFGTGSATALNAGKIWVTISTMTVPTGQ